MRNSRVVLVVLAVAALVVPYSPAAAAKAPTVKLSMSNFRYCPGEACTPFDVGYLRSSEGPVDGADNPRAVVEVKRGTVVTWVYRDAACDDFGCPGHNVVFENGTVQGSRKGFTPSEQGPKTIKVKITRKAGATIRYFCSVNNHYEVGMTGILRVVR